MTSLSKEALNQDLFLVMFCICNLPLFMSFGISTPFSIVHVIHVGISTLFSIGNPEIIRILVRKALENGTGLTAECKLIFIFY